MAAPYTAGFLGMRGSGDWSTTERPTSFREMILYLYPNGAAPLTGILSKMGGEAITDVTHTWFQRALDPQGGDATAVYIDQLSTTYVYATHQATYGIAGSTLYIKCAESVVSGIRPKHTVVLRDADRLEVDVMAYVKAVVKAGASSYLVVMLLEADDNATDASTYNLSTVDTVLVKGNGQAEGDVLPDSIAYDPTPLYNYTQIFVTPLSITRTARKTKLRTEDQYRRAKREALMYHGIEMENATIFSERYLGTGDNGKPLHFMRGIRNWIRSDSDAVRSDFRYDTDYAGKAWLASGEDWLDDKLDTVRRWNDSTEVLGICGSAFTRAVNRLAKAHGYIAMTPTIAAYGMKVNAWNANGLNVQLLEHPLFNLNASERSMCIIGDPRRLKYRYIDDTMFLSDPGEKLAGWVRRDATDEAYLTEFTLELHHAKGWAELSGAGFDNLV